MLRLAVTGAQGRMGQAVARCAAEQPARFAVTAFLNRQSAGQDLPPHVDALIDFSTPEASLHYAAQAAPRGLVHVIGTTGFSAAQEDELKRLSARAVMVKSANMSVGVHVLAQCVKRAAHQLGADFDIEILEMHHRNKADAPSGTAKFLGQAAAEARGAAAEPLDRGGRRGDGIGYAVLRGGSVVGEHEVMFAGPSERITLKHSAEDRAVFARGALRAALWAQGKAAGLYTMRDVLS